MRSMLMRAATKRRTWVALFLLAYAILLSSSWNLLRSILTWYYQSTASAAASSSPAFGLWPALYAALLFGGVFGFLSMAAAVTIVIPATVVTWITVLVLLAFAGKPRRALVLDGRRITSDILSFAVKIVLKEGNIVAAASAIVSFFVLLRGRG
ncbi:hypothetical protein ACLOJK_041385, partial [Asimina triloba]